VKLSEVKRRNQIIGVVLAVGITYWSGLDVLLRRYGSPVFLVCALVPLFVLFPMLIEYLERKFVK
jgi:ABC-type nitrate/sulfonate/bicarbonate transport system permease component